MDFLKLFSREVAAPPMGLPSGTFTIDRTGRMVTSTISNIFPEKVSLEIGHAVLDTFRKAKAADVVLTELTINFAAIKLTARELRGGAIIFLAPRSAAESR
jgi:hypothetical protein